MKNANRFVSVNVIAFAGQGKFGNLFKLVDSKVLINQNALNQLNPEKMQSKQFTVDVQDAGVYRNSQQKDNVFILSCLDVDDQEHMFVCYENIEEFRSKYGDILDFHF